MPACLRFFEHPCDSCFWDVTKIQTLAARPRMVWAKADFCIFGSPCRKRTLFPVGDVDSRDLHRIARTCAGTGGRCSISGQKHVHPKASASPQSMVLHVTTRPPSPFVFRACHGSHHEHTHDDSREHILGAAWDRHSTRQRILVCELLTLRISVDQKNGGRGACCSGWFSLRLSNSTQVLVTIAATLKIFA